MGKSVLITGATKGLGRSLAIQFAANGYNLVLHGRDKTELDQLKRETLGVSCETIEGDLRQKETIDRLMIKARENDIYILINNAGVCVNLPLEEFQEEDLQSMLDVNLTAPIRLARGVYSFFKQRKSGVIVNICSFDSLYPRKHSAIYSATKYGLRGFTDSLRLESKEHGVRVIGIYPAGMDTPGYRRNRGEPQPGKVMDTKDVAKTIFEACNNPTSSIEDLILRK